MSERRRMRLGWTQSYITEEYGIVHILRFKKERQFLERFEQLRHWRNFSRNQGEEISHSVLCVCGGGDERKLENRIEECR